MPRTRAAVFRKPRLAKKYTFGQGLFDDQSGWTLTREIIADDKPEHYALGDKGQKAFTAWSTFWAVLLGRLPR